MVATEAGHLKCRFCLKATWTDDGSVDGTVAESLFVIRTFKKDYGEEDCCPLRAMDQSRIQMVYVPASRDGARHLTTFLKSRLWRAGQWSDEFRSAVDEAATEIGRSVPSRTRRGRDRTGGKRPMELPATGNVREHSRPSALSIVISRSLLTRLNSCSLQASPVTSGVRTNSAMANARCYR